jgi:hypothetical protein
MFEVAEASKEKQKHSEGKQKKRNTRRSLTMLLPQLRLG